MCLLIITSNSRCIHNTYRYGKCSEDTNFNQCPHKRTEAGAVEGKCPACESWVALAWRTWAERVNWAQERHTAEEAEQNRRWSTMWQEGNPLRDTPTQSPADSSSGTTPTNLGGIWSHASRW